MEKTLILFKDIKFEHSIFALPFAYLGLFLAERGAPGFFLFFWVTIAMVSFRTFAMAVNRLIDHEIDARNPRTRSRALPQAQLTARFVSLTAFLSLILFVGCAWVLGPLCLFLSPLPVFLAWIYPYLKRFTWFSHGVLGMILGISPYGSWLAGRGEFSWIPGFLLIGVAGWVAGFDILYSLQDLEVDRREGLKSVPARFGKDRALQAAAVLHLIALLAWMASGRAAGLGWIYALGLVVVAAFLVREHWLLRRFGTAKMDQAFFTLNACVSVVVFLSALADRML